MMFSIIPLIISGPSGSGKSTLIEKLIKEFPGKFSFSISHTTRKPREGEQHGVNYYYITEEEFKQMTDQDKFIEYEFHYNTYYGTSKAEIDRIVHQNLIPLLDIDIKGAINVIKNKRLPITNHFFIKTVTPEILVQRLQKRKSESEEQVKMRLDNAFKEIDLAINSQLYNQDNIIINDQLESSYKIFSEKIKLLYYNILCSK